MFGPFTVMASTLFQDRHLLYLMHGGNADAGYYYKFGIGGIDRVRGHVYYRATIVEVLEEPLQQVRDAETLLKQAHAALILRSRPGHLPRSFGWGWEIVPDSVDVDLRGVLGDGKESVAGECVDYFTRGLEHDYRYTLVA